MLDGNQTRKGYLRDYIFGITNNVRNYFYLQGSIWLSCRVHTDEGKHEVKNM